MIISASRRTDIPSFYADWFFHRIKEQSVLVRNPLNIHQVSKIDLAPTVVDCLVFWTKNPLPMLKRLPELQEYNYYFQFSLTAYDKDIEKNLPCKNNSIINTFKLLSDKIGADRVIWRYDPILINHKYTIDYHVNCFAKIAQKLADYTKQCTISFLDNYKSIQNTLQELKVVSLAEEQQRYLAQQLAAIADSYKIKMATCAENIDLSDFNIKYAKCIDDKLIEKITGNKLLVKKDANQRVECGCIASIDIGMYNTCKNGCKYCYANHNLNTVAKNFQNYDPLSPLLCSTLTDADKVTTRKMHTIVDQQTTLDF